MASLRDPIAQDIVEALTAEQVARAYGFTPNRAGFINCPFHKGDETASLKLYPGNRGWCCFGCHSGGNVINFVMKLFNITYRQAITRIKYDFGLNIACSGSLNISQASKLLQQRVKEEAELKEYRAEYDRRTNLYREYQLAIKAGPTAPLFDDAVKNIDTLDYWFEEHRWR